MKQFQENNINIVYASDDKYAMIMAVSMESLFENNIGDPCLEVFIIESDISLTNKEKLKQIALSHNRNLNFVTIESINNIVGTKVFAQRWNPIVFARLYCPTLFPALDRILYLDCDTVINDNIFSIWNEDITGYSCAAVQEPISYGHKKNLGLNKNDLYFNSGVMLIDLKKWRYDHTERKFSFFIKSRNGKIPYVDQGVINAVINNEIKILPVINNMSTQNYEYGYSDYQAYRGDRIIYKEEEIEEGLNNPTIIHFTSSFKTLRPWIKNSNHPKVEIWEKYRTVTPWKDTELWRDNREIKKIIIAKIINTLPKKIGILIAHLVNSVIRPMIDR